jgi:hemoglobin/transferrin/lactoferrin receptor protein
MRKILLLCYLIGMTGYIHSQNITIRDNETLEPIEMVNLISKNQKIATITNSIGQADISAFKGAKKIEITILGYQTEIRSYSELESSSFEIKLIRSDVDIEEVVISANRWNQRLKDIPSKIVSISPTELMLQNPQTAADMLGTTGGVFIQKSQQGGGSPMIRGFSTNRLLYSVDGIRMNTAIFRSGNLQNVISLDPFATEKAEVFFGPGSVVYGSDAIGGVMAFQTLTPLLSLEEKPVITGKTNLRHSTANNEKTAHFDLNLGFKKWAFLTSISSNNFGDLRMGSYGPDEYLRPFYVQRYDSTDVVVTNENPRLQKPSGYSQINMMQKVRFSPNQKWDIQYAFHYSETSEYSRYDRHIRYKNGLPRYGEWYYGPQKWMMNNLIIRQKAKNKLYDQMTIRLAQQYFEESRIDRDMNKTDRHIRIEKVNAYSLNFDFDKSFGSKHEIFYGIEAVKDFVNSSGIDQDIATGISALGPSRYPESSWESYAAYLSYQFRFSEKLLVQLGSRYNQYMLDATFDTGFYPFPFNSATMNKGALTGSAGIVFRPNNKWAISANASTGFRSPNVDDVGKVFDSEQGSVVVPNPGLSAEYAYNAEISIAKLFGDFAKIDIAAYYTLLQNAMVRRDFTLNGLDSIMYDGTLSQVQALQNAAFAKVYGIQAGFNFKFAYGFGFSSDFNYQIGEEELDDGTTSPSRHAPPWFGVSRLKYTANKLNMEFYAVYSGERRFEDLPEEEKGKPEIYAIDENGNPYSPGWYTLNFKAMYKLTDSFIVSAGLENITDQRYRPYSSGIVAPGRNFILSFKAAF